MKYTVKATLNGGPQTLKLTAGDKTEAELEAETMLRKLAARKGDFAPTIKIIKAEAVKQ